MNIRTPEKPISSQEYEISGHLAGLFRDPDDPNESWKLEWMTGLFINLLTDVCTHNCVSERERLRDVQTILSRSQKEGTGFFTKTLPKLGKSVIQGLLEGHLPLLAGFKLKADSKHPKLLGELLDQIFHSDGKLRKEPSISAICDIVQLTQIFYKLEFPFSKRMLYKKVQAYINLDKSLPDDFTHLRRPYGGRLEELVLDLARKLITHLFKGLDPYEVIPQHGPGATYDYATPAEKSLFTRVFKSTEEHYPHHEYYFMGNWYYSNMHETRGQLEFQDYPVSRLQFVSKDSRGPRTICIESHELLWIQGGLRKTLTKHIEEHPLTKGKVNFSDQTINRALALESSKSGIFATLDMKDASDRVSVALVKELFGDTKLLGPLMSLRSQAVLLPETVTPWGVELPQMMLNNLKKFAPMGSALCFPIEAIVFWSLAIACRHVVGAEPLKTALATTYVYGDDLIVDSAGVKPILDTFHYFGLRLNKGKSCYTGLFRESCGCDAFNGENIAPTRIKKFPFTKSTDGTSITAQVELSNRFYLRGYPRASRYLLKRVEEVLGTLPLCTRKDVLVDGDNSDPIFKHWKTEPIQQAPYHRIITYQKLPFNVREVLISPNRAVSKVRRTVGYKKCKYNQLLDRYERKYPVLSPLSVGVSYSQPNWEERKCMEYLRSLLGSSGSVVDVSKDSCPIAKLGVRRNNARLRAETYSYPAEEFRSKIKLRVLAYDINSISACKNIRCQWSSDRKEL